MQPNRVRIAIQKEGRLNDESMNLFQSLGFKFKDSSRGSLIVPCENADLEILCVRHGDIPQYVEQGVADFAILGGNILFEADFAVKVISKLGFGKCSLVLAIPEDSKISDCADLDGERIATSYPNSLKKFLKSKKINASVIPIRGSVEITCSLGLADAICDIVQTGRTLQDNSLKILEPLYESEAILIESLVTNPAKSIFFEKFSNFRL